MLYAEIYAAVAVVILVFVVRIFDTSDSEYRGTPSMVLGCLAAFFWPVFLTLELKDRFDKRRTTHWIDETDQHPATSHADKEGLVSCEVFCF